MVQKTLWPGWEMVKPIGSGGFGKVYEIKRIVGGEEERAALKVISIPQSDSDVEELRSDGYDEASIIQRFQSYLDDIISEYSIMSKMRGNTNIVDCDDLRYFQREDGFGWDIYIKMELLTPLSQALKGPVEDETVMQVGIDICHALELCQQNSVIHRDIKPQNIFLSRYGAYKLGDFGIAKATERTTSGTKIGTYKYMAPEVYKGQPYGLKADLYSLGLVLYWMLNERRMPFLPLPPEIPTSSQEDESRTRRFQGEALPPPAHGSAQLKEVVLRTCAFQAEDRYATPVQLRTVLERLKQSNDTTALPIFLQERSEDLTVGHSFPGTQDVLSPVPLTQETWDDNNIGETVGPSFNVFQPTPTPFPPERFEDLTVGHSFPSTQDVLFPVPLTQESWDDNDSGETVGPSFNGFQPTPTPSHPRPKRRTILLTIGALCAAMLIFFAIQFLPGFFHPQKEPVTTQEASAVDIMPTVTTPSAAHVWSEWTEALPSQVTVDDYTIEEKKMYSYRDKETKASEQKSMEGWTLDNSRTSHGGYGPWSEWSQTPVSASSTREVEQGTKYRYCDKETTTSTSQTLAGWTLYDTASTLGNYGNWSSWSASSVSSSEDRQVETKTQYSYRTATVTQSYSDWSGWSNWQDSSVSASDTTEVQTRNAYHYYYYVCPNCGTHMHGWGNGACYTWAGGCGATISTDSYHVVRSEISYSSAGDWYGTGVRYASTSNGTAFAYTSPDSAYYIGPITQYSYRTRSLQDSTNWSEWSSYSDSRRSSSATVEERSRTLYRYRDRTRVYTYHFQRWGSWSNWGDNAVNQSDSRQVQSQVFYRYRERLEETTYLFYRWGDWTAFSEDAVSASDSREVRTQTLYRYLQK